MKLEAFFAPLCTLCKFDRITITIEITHEVNVQAHRRENKEGSDFQKGVGVGTLLHAAVTSFPKCPIRRGFDLRCLTYAGTEEERETERRCFLEEA